MCILVLAEADAATVVQMCVGVCMIISHVKVTSEIQVGKGALMLFAT